MYAGLKYLYVLPLVVMAIALFARPQAGYAMPHQEPVVAIRAPIIEVVPGDTIYEIVDEMPQYPGGMKGLMRYITRNLRYPREAQEAGIQGRVVVVFVVDIDGSVTNAQVLESVDPHLDREALRLINAMKKWTPGKHRGKVVKVMYSVPLSFRIESQPPTLFPHQGSHRPFNRP
jgi:TonB family protein